MEKYCKSCGRVFKDSDFKLCPYCGNQLSERVGRQPIPRKLRHIVFQRDDYMCRECGATNKQTRLHVDHIIPVAKGGTNDLDNLQTLCEDCNKAKYTDEWVGGEVEFDHTSTIKYDVPIKIHIRSNKWIYGGLLNSMSYYYTANTKNELERKIKSKVALGRIMDRIIID